MKTKLTLLTCLAAMALNQSTMAGPGDIGSAGITTNSLDVGKQVCLTDVAPIFYQRYITANKDSLQGLTRTDVWDRVNPLMKAEGLNIGETCIEAKIVSSRIEKVESWNVKYFTLELTGQRYSLEKVIEVPANAFYTLEGTTNGWTAGQKSAYFLPWSVSNKKNLLTVVGFRFNSASEEFSFVTNRMDTKGVVEKFEIEAKHVVNGLNQAALCEEFQNNFVLCKQDPVFIRDLTISGTFNSQPAEFVTGQLETYFGTIAEESPTSSGLLRIVTSLVNDVLELNELSISALNMNLPSNVFKISQDRKTATNVEGIVIDLETLRVIRSTK